MTVVLGNKAATFCVTLHRNMIIKRIATDHRCARVNAFVARVPFNFHGARKNIVNGFVGFKLLFKLVFCFQIFGQAIAFAHQFCNAISYPVVNA